MKIDENEWRIKKYKRWSVNYIELIQLGFTILVYNHLLKIYFFLRCLVVVTKNHYQVSLPSISQKELRWCEYQQYHSEHLSYKSHLKGSAGSTPRANNMFPEPLDRIGLLELVSKCLEPPKTSKQPIICVHHKIHKIV